MMKRLLAATDFSAPARHAAERAAQIARETGAELDLVHVASLAPLQSFQRLVSGSPPGLDQRVLDAAREALRALAASLQHHHGVAAREHIVSGALLAELLQFADATAADLIVLGASGTSFMRHLVLGSTAERMVSKASRPLLVVKQRPHEAYTRVLLPVDFSDWSLPAIAQARAIAPAAQLVLLHVFDVSFESSLRYAGVDDALVDRYRLAAREEALTRLRSLRDKAGLPADLGEMVVFRGDPGQHIIEQEREQDCDLIVIGKHGENMLEDMLLGSVTRHVLTESHSDVLVSV